VRRALPMAPREAAIAATETATRWRWCIAPDGRGW
jgi:hypothetical protein